MDYKLSNFAVKNGNVFMPVDTIELSRGADTLYDYGLPLTNFDFSSNISVECKSEKVTDFFSSCYNGELKCGDSIDIYHLTPDGYVQARKHKKKRINKKWLKRYGYKPKYKKVKTKTKFVESNPIFSQDKTGEKFITGIDMTLGIVGDKDD